MDLDGCLRPVDPQLVRLDLGSIGRGAELFGRNTQSVLQRRDQEPAADIDQLVAELVCSHRVTDRHVDPGVHATGVEPFLDGHHAHAGDTVTLEQRSLDRSRATASAAAARSADSPSAAPPTRVA